MADTDLDGHGPEQRSAETNAPTNAAMPSVFKSLLLNTLVTGVTSSFVWFALTFWVYLETRSVIATGVIGGAFSITSALFAPAFGTYVDRHRKHTSLVATTALATVCFAIAGLIYVSVDREQLLQLDSPAFWALVAATLLGSVAAMMRGIVLGTLVTLLVPEPSRDRANGFVGTISGVSFAITSVFSGLVIGGAGMGWAYAISIVFTAAALLHVLTIRFDEPEPQPVDPNTRQRTFDIGTAVTAIRGVPGLGLLIGLAAFNNLLGGVFMALMDAYGLELVSVQTWGFLWGGISLAFIAGGLAVAKFGLGSSPVRLIVMLNLINWTVSSIFTLRSSIVLLALGMLVWLTLIPVIEAAEQTVLQNAIPFETQGRVFGFAQMIENAATPLTAFLIAPLAEQVFMPWMSEGGGGADAIGSWFGVGPERGMAVIFTLAGLTGAVVTLLVWRSRSFRKLAARTATRAAAT